MMNTFHRLVLVISLFLFIVLMLELPLYAQTSKDSSDIQIKTNRSGLDSTVTYTSRDSTVFSLKKRTMLLKGDAEISIKKQKLNAESIEIDFNESMVKAQGKKDSVGLKIGYPRFEDNGEEFTGETILFNLETKKGTITY